MGLFDRCSRCRRFLLIRGRRADGLCPDCYARRQEEERRRHERHEQTMQRKQKRRQEIRKRQEERIREELHQQHERQPGHKDSQEAKTQANQASGTTLAPSIARRAREGRGAKKSEIKGPDPQEDEAYLYVFVSVKKVRAEEYLYGKRRVALNKDREIRRTHAGGFSAEKFQRFVDAKRAHAYEWVQGLLDRPGVLKGPYDRITVESPDQKLKSAIEGHLRTSGSYAGQSDAL